MKILKSNVYFYIYKIGGQSLKNNRANNTNVLAVPSIDLNLMNRMSVINNLHSLNNEHQNIMNNFNGDSATNERLSQLLMTIALNNNADMNKLVNSTTTTTTTNNNNNEDTTSNNNNTNYFINNNITNTSNNNNNNININTNINNNTNNITNNTINTNVNTNANINNNSLLSQDFLLQLLQQQQQLQQQLQILQQQHQQLQQQHQLNDNKEIKMETNMMTSPNINMNSYAQNMNANPLNSSFPSNNLRSNENVQGLNNFYQYFSQMNDNSMPKVDNESNNYLKQQLYMAQQNQAKMNSLSMPSYLLPVNTHPVPSSPYTSSIPTSFAVTPNILSTPIGMGLNVGNNERNGDFLKQEFTKPPKIPSHLISSSLISSGLEESLDEKRRMKASLNKGMSPLIATVAPMTMVTNNNNAMMNATMAVQENSELNKENLDISKKKSLSNSSSTSLSSTTTLENEKNALLSSNDAGSSRNPLTEASSPLQQVSNNNNNSNNNNSSTTSSNSTLASIPNINIEGDNEESNESKQQKSSSSSKRNSRSSEGGEKDANKESSTVAIVEGTSSVSTPKLINATVETKSNNDGNNELLFMDKVREGIEVMNLGGEGGGGGEQESFSNDNFKINLDSSATLGTTPTASSLNRYISVISAAENQQDSMINNDDKKSELPILRIGQPLPDFSSSGLMINNNGNISLNGISNSFSDGFDLLNLPSYRLNYLSNNNNLVNKLNNFTTNDGLLSANKNIGNISSNNSSNGNPNSNLGSFNDKKDLDFLSFSSSAATPSSLIGSNQLLCPPSAAIPIYKNNKKPSLSGNSSNSMLNDNSYNGFFGMYPIFFIIFLIRFLTLIIYIIYIYLLIYQSIYLYRVTKKFI